MASFRPQTTNSPGRGFSHLFATSVSSLSTSLAGVRRRARSSRTVPLNTLVLSAALLLGGFLVGSFVSTQWEARAASSVSSSSPVTRQSDREIVAATISRLETEQATLKQRISDQREQLTLLQGSDAKSKTTLLDLNNEIARQRTASGMVALQGPGVVATFDDSTARSIPENEDPANFILHDYDLRDVLNTLWVAGAEAISVNGERIVSNTSLYCVGTTIICNATRLSPPYEIRAVGDSQVLAGALQNSPQMAKFNQRAQIYDLPQKIEQKPDVTVPAYNGSFVFKYAQVQGQQ